MELKANTKNKIPTFPIRIRKDGAWFHEGRLIERQSLVKLFAQILVRDGKGNYWLETPYERGCIEVEDTPFVIVDYMIENHQGENIYLFKSNLDQNFKLCEDKQLFFRNSAPILILPGRLEARLLRSVFFALLNEACDKKSQTITSNGISFSLLDE